MPTFNYRYLDQTFTATIEGDRLTIKQGLRTFDVPLDRLKSFYVKRWFPTSRGTFEELILAIEKTAGKTRIIRSLANEGEASFGALVEALAARHPAGDLRGLGERAALKLMGAADTARLVLLFVLPALAIVVMLIVTLPWLIHGLDQGGARITVDELAAHTPTGTRNLELVGLVDAAHIVHETITQKGRSTHHYFAPLVPRGWTPSAPVHVVLERGEDESFSSRGVHRCTLRNVLWEGLSRDNKSFFAQYHRLRIADDVQLCQLAPRGSRDDLMMFVLCMAITVVTVSILIFVVALRMRKAARRATASPPPGGR
jgi:hypothetical protein